MQERTARERKRHVREFLRGCNRLDHHADFMSETRLALIDTYAIAAVVDESELVLARLHVERGQPRNVVARPRFDLIARREQAWIGHAGDGDRPVAAQLHAFE